MTNQSRHGTSVEAGVVEFADNSSMAVASVVAVVPKPDLIPASEWDYRTIKQLGDSLRQRKVSALELLEHTIARIEALDQRLNAVVVRDFERAGDGRQPRPTSLSAVAINGSCLAFR